MRYLKEWVQSGCGWVPSSWGISGELGIIGVPQHASTLQHPPGETLMKVQEGEIAPGTIVLRGVGIFLLIHALEGCLADFRRYGRYGTGRGVG